MVDCISGKLMTDFGRMNVVIPKNLPMCGITFYVIAVTVSILIAIPHYAVVINNGNVVVKHYGTV